MSEVNRYRLKPVEFEAIQWTGENERAVHAFLMPDNNTNQCVSTHDFLVKDDNDVLLVKTLHNWMTCPIDDFVTKQKHGGVGVIGEATLAVDYEKIHVPHIPIDDQEA